MRRRRREARLIQQVTAVAAIPLLAMSALALAWIGDRESVAERAARERELADLVVELTDLARAVRGDQTVELAMSVAPRMDIPGADEFLDDRLADVDARREAALAALADRSVLIDEVAGPGTWASLERSVVAATGGSVPPPDPGLVDPGLPALAVETGTGGIVRRIQEIRSRVAETAIGGDATVRSLVQTSIFTELGMEEAVLLAEDLADGEVDPEAADRVRALAARQDERAEALRDFPVESVQELVGVVIDGEQERQWRRTRRDYLAAEGSTSGAGPLQVEAVAVLIQGRSETQRDAIGRIGQVLTSEAAAREDAAHQEVLVLRVGVLVAIVGTSLLTLFAVRSAQAKVRQVHRATARLEASERYARSVIDTASEAVLVVGADRRIIDTNATLDRSVGIDVVGRPVDDILPDLERIDDLAELDNVELSLQRHERLPTPVLVSAGATTTPDGDRVVTLFARDISERKSFEAELEHLASHDSLTGLPNRATVLRTIQRARRRAKRIRSNVAVMFIDLDGFKGVNDTRGHQVGDALLREVAVRLLEQVRPYDTVGRLGGDEFVIVLDDITTEEAEATARRVLSDLRRPIVLGEEVRIGASIGLAIDDGGRPCDADQLLQEADLAMYRAKHGGRNRIERFDEEMQTWMQVRSELENGLRAALAEDEGLELHAQPLVDLRTGRVSSVELLARWHRADGPVPPAQFVPIAEESGLAIDLGRWALREACRTSRALAEAFPHDPIRVAVNVSGHHVAQARLATDLAEVLEETGAQPAHLTIELTESQLLDDLSAAIEELERVRRLGVEISIDDFGTGYSSLTYLNRLPVTSVKIDRSFVADLDSPSGDPSVVQMIIDLARLRGLATVGEGVETQEQADELVRFGCTTGQGYLFHPPVPLDEAIGLIAARNGAVARVASVLS